METVCSLQHSRNDKLFIGDNIRGFIRSLLLLPDDGQRLLLGIKSSPNAPCCAALITIESEKNMDRGVDRAGRELFTAPQTLTNVLFLYFIAL